SATRAEGCVAACCERSEGSLPLRMYPSASASGRRATLRARKSEIVGGVAGARIPYDRRSIGWGQFSGHRLKDALQRDFAESDRVGEAVVREDLGVDFA